MTSGVHDTGWQPLARPPRRPPSRTRQAFSRLALTHALSTAGDAMVTVALAGSLFFSISPTAARGKVALSLVFTMLPFAVVAPFLGPAIDRSRAGRRVMMFAAAAGRAGAALVMAREIHSLLLFPAALVLLILSKAQAVAKSSLVPATVASPERLVQAGGRLAMIAAIVGFVTAGPSAAILKLFGGAWLLRVAFVVYAAAAVSAFRLRPAPEHRPVQAETATVDETALHRGVTLAATSMAVLRGIVGYLTFAVAFDFRRTHAPSWWFGVVLGASVVGGFAGAVVGPRLRAVLREERMLTATVGSVALVALITSHWGSREALAGLAFAVGLCAGAARLAFDAIVQRDAEEELRGRSFARFEATFQLAWVVGSIIPVIVAIPNRTSCFIIAVSAGMATASYTTGLRALGPAARVALRRPPPRPLGPGGVRWLEDDEMPAS